MLRYTVLRIDEQDYGCEDLPDGCAVQCDVLLADETGAQIVRAVPDALLTERGIREGDTVIFDEVQGLQRFNLPEKSAQTQPCAKCAKKM
jgi:hypothetical protein